MGHWPLRKGETDAGSEGGKPGGRPGEGGCAAIRKEAGGLVGPQEYF